MVAELRYHIYGYIYIFNGRNRFNTYEHDGIYIDICIFTPVSIRRTYIRSFHFYAE